MIIVNAAMRQDEIQTALEAKSFEFVKKQGLKLYFNAPTDDLAKEVVNAKSILKATRSLSGVFFNVEVAK